MKIPLALAFLLLGASGAFATVTLQFGSSAIYASNWANGAGVGGSNLVWGIIVDADGDGFDFNDTSNYRSGVSLTAGAQTLTTYATNQVSDDVLYISPALMTLVVSTVDGAATGMNRVTAIANMPMNGNVGTGDNFVIVWFDRTALGGTLQAGDKFGVFGNGIFTLPAESATQPYTSAFTGPDALKPLGFYWQGIPEPSSLLLGLLGGLGFLRRRR